jgi:hypothetical protein
MGFDSILAFAVDYGPPGLAKRFEAANDRCSFLRVTRPWTWENKYRYFDGNVPPRRGGR